MKASVSVSGAALFLALLGPGIANAALPIQIDMSRFNPKHLPGPHPVTRERLCLNGEWDFYPILNRKKMHGPALEELPPLPAEAEWKRFRVPAKWKRVSGTWSATDYGIPKEWCWANCAWYRRSFTVPERMRGKRIKLHFGGVLVYCEVFVNDRSVGKHYSGVTPFTLDVTDLVRFDGPNALRLYVANQDVLYIDKPKSRYMFTCRAPIYYGYSQGSAGIWQDVFLFGEPALTVDDACVRTSVRGKEITADVTLVNAGAGPVRVQVAPVVTDLEGGVVKRLGARTVTVTPGRETVVAFRESWADARPWSPEDPHLYRLHTRVMSGRTSRTSTGRLIDEHFQRFGFREFWIEGRDFFLNGRRITLLGDWMGRSPSGCDAYLRPEYLRAYFKAYKDANYRGPRVQMSAPAALDVCDELGFIQIATGMSDGPRFFDPDWVDQAMQIALKEARDWVRRDRNHPCIVAWSTENEDGYPRDEKVRERYKAIDRVFIEMDPTRPFMHDGNNRGGGDFGGFAPVKNFHYGGASLERQIHAFEEWSRTDTKPRIQGEISNYALEFSRFSHLLRYMGDRVFDELDVRYREADRVIRLQGGGWRSYGLSGIMLFSNKQAIMNAPLNATFPGAWQKPVLKFEWDDLETPYPKPAYLGRTNLDFVNPWTDAAPDVIRTPMFESIRHILSPVLVSLARSPEHTYWCGQKAVKNAYIVNEGTGDLRGARLAWTLKTETGEDIASGDVPCRLAQGEIRAQPVSLTFPSFTARTVLRFDARLLSGGGRLLSEDWQELSVYPRPARVPLAGSVSYLYDGEGRTERVFREHKIPYRKVTIEDVSALPANALLIIGYRAADADLIAATGPLTTFVERGGRVLMLAQPMHGSRSRSVVFVRAPSHPVFRGLPRERMMFWRSESREIAKYPIVANPALRQKILAEVLDNPDGELYTRYLAALVENIAGKGRVVLSALNITEGCEKDDPEAVIMLHNLLRHMTSPVAPSPIRARFVGGDKRRTFFTEALLTAGLEQAPQGDWTTGLRPGDVVIIGDSVPPAALSANKRTIARFVSRGGIVLGAGVKTEGEITWTPYALRTRKLEWQVRPVYRYSTGTFHLWKRSESRALDGLGDMFVFETPRARRYFIGDRIRGLDYGFVKPGEPWDVDYEIAVRATASCGGLRRRAHYESDGDAALVTLPHGRGMYILCALPARKTEISTRLYGALLTNLDVPAARTQPFLAFSRLVVNVALKPAGRRDWHGYTPIDLVPHANRTFMDKTAGDRLGGWDDSGPNDMRNLPTGDFVMGVPFHIIDREKDDPNGDRAIKLGHPIGSCIVLEGQARPYFPKKVEGIKVGRKARKIYFLHTATWCAGKAGDRLARYVLHYEDGSTHEIPLRKNRELADWTKVGRFELKAGRVAWRGSNPEHGNVGLFRLSVVNPHKEKKIDSIDFVSDGKAIPILVAITVQR